MSINYNVKIMSRIDTDVNDETQALNIARTFIINLDTVNDAAAGDNIITKLYYIAPKIGKFFVLVTDEDAKLLGIENPILANENIKDYPYIKLPNKIIVYKELIIKVGQDLSNEEIKNLAQAIADDTFEQVKPYQIPVVKVIDYNTNESFIVMPSIFGDNVFAVDSNTVIQTDGDSEAGTDSLNLINILNAGAVMNVKKIQISDLKDKNGNLIKGTDKYYFCLLVNGIESTPSTEVTDIYGLDITCARNIALCTNVNKDDINNNKFKDNKEQPYGWSYKKSINIYALGVSWGLHKNDMFVYEAIVKMFDENENLLFQKIINSHDMTVLNLRTDNEVVYQSGYIVKTDHNKSNNDTNIIGVPESDFLS